MTMVIFEVDAGQEEKLTDQVRTVVPVVRPVIVELFCEGLVIVPGPETFTHNPVPTAGEFPANVAIPDVAQTV